jgi:hypothetical protein
VKIVTVVVVIATIILAGFAGFLWLTEPFRIASLDAGGDLRIEIIGVPDSDWDTAPLLYYEIRKQGSLVVGRHYLWVPYDGVNCKDYRLLILDGGSLIAVFEQSTPHCLSVLYDAATGEHYPCVGECVPHPRTPSKQLRDRLVSRVIALTNDDRYKHAESYVVGRDN